MKSTKTACLITAVVIALSAVLGCNRSLAALKGKTADMVVDAGATGYNIATDCQDMVNTARNLTTVAKKYLSRDQGLFEELESCCRRMEQAGADAGERKEAALGIRSVSESILLELDKTGQVSEKDRGYLSGFSVDLRSAMDRMSRDPYNAAAGEFNRIERSFPANVLGFLVGPLEQFAF